MRPLRALALSATFAAGVMLLIWATFSYLRTAI